ncbi:MAG: RNA polymerase sigma factor [Chitinophagaceae bacterium]
MSHLDSIFAANRNRLRSYLFRMTAHKEDTEDLLQDTYLKASENLGSFREQSSLETWIFAIATNLTRDYLRKKRRWPVAAMDLAREESMLHPEIHLARFLRVNQSSPQGAFDVKEHINFCFTCIGKTLPADEQAALLLKEIFAYKIGEIATILACSEGVVKHLLYNARATMQRIFAKRCSLVNKEGACHQCSELNGIFNPKQQLQQNLIRSAEDDSDKKLLDIRMKIARSIDPFESSGAELQFCHYAHVATTAGNKE